MFGYHHYVLAVHLIIKRIKTPSKLGGFFMIYLSFAILRSNYLSFYKLRSYSVIYAFGSFF
jgi:hypothetical protein